MYDVKLVVRTSKFFATFNIQSFLHDYFNDF